MVSCISSVVLIVTRKGEGGIEYLLQKRQNTGYMDDYWDFGVSGHVEQGESPMEAILRETEEEIGIVLGHSDIKFAIKVHQKNLQNSSYIHTYFITDLKEGKVKINDKEKISELKWFSFNDLPTNLIKDRRIALYEYMKGNSSLELTDVNPML